MSIFKPYPEINFVDGQADGLNRIQTNSGKVIIAGHFDSPDFGQRLVDCWNATRKIFAPAAHLEASEDYCTRLEKLRKEAVARLEQAEAGNTVSASGWNHDMTACPLGKEVTTTRLVADKTSASGKTVRDFKEYQRDDVILASKCGKVIKSYWIPDEKRFAGFQPNEEIVAWMAWPSHPGVVSQEVAA